MARFFPVMATLLALAMLTSIAVGFWSFSLPHDNEFWAQVFIVHYFIGLFTAIGILFVHCVIFIYFLGTGRWIKEVTLAYQMPDEPHHKQTRELKRKVFPPALYAMLIGIAAAAAGAGAQTQAWPWYVHMTLALATLLINLWAFRIEYDCVRTNGCVLRAVLEDVDRIRLARGLSTNAEALAEDAARVSEMRKQG
jgi:amino acid transporter